HPRSVLGQRHAGARLPARVLRLGVLLRGPAVPQRAVRHARARRRRRLHLQRRPGGRRALSLPGRRGVRSDAAVRRDQLVCGDLLRADARRRVGPHRNQGHRLAVLAHVPAKWRPARCMRDTIEFVLNGEVRRLDSVDPTLTVLRYLRESERLVGTKEGCAEGDCGACTAVVATLEGAALRYRAVNTCIQFVGMLDGKALITVEHLKSEGSLHPVQQAMVDHHASQCGFCTPGFVMSLFAGCREGATSERSAIDTLLAGNLCRCTGYTAIIRAAEQSLRSHAGKDRFVARERQLIDRLRQIRRRDSICIEADGRRYFAPGSADELARLLRRHPAATLVAGATDVGRFVTKQHRRLDTVIDLGKVKELARISRGKAGLRLGAAVTYERAHRELAALYPSLHELIRRLGSVQVRNLGTIGGNIANGSPIGDMPPALIAAGAPPRPRPAPGAPAQRRAGR